MIDELTILQAAPLTDVSVRYLQQQCAAGHIPARRIGKNWVITREALANFELRDRKIGPKFKNKSQNNS